MKKKKFGDSRDNPAWKREVVAAKKRIAGKKDVSRQQMTLSDKLAKDFPDKKIWGVSIFKSWWEDEFRQFIDKVFKPKMGGMVNLDRELLVNFVHNVIREERIKVLDFISDKQGWEESRDIYAEKLGLPRKYKNKK